MLPTSGPQGAPVYWQGQDGNFYTKGVGGNWAVQNMGTSLAPLSPQTISGMTQIADPNAAPSGGRSAPTGGGGGASSNPMAVYQQSFLNSLPSALSNINQGGADAFGQAQNQYQGSANNIFTGFRTGQQNVDIGRQNNELSRLNATQDLLGYIRNGLHQGASQLANMNATDSSAAGALGQAYNLEGAQKQRSINNQAAVQGHTLDIQQNNLNQGLNDQLTQLHLTRDNLANQIASNVRSQLAALDTQGAGLGITGKVDVEGQKQAIVNNGMAQLQGVDQWLQGQLGGIHPMSADQVQAQAYQLQQAGNASPNAFTVNPIQNSFSQLQGPQISQLPLFSIKKNQQ